MFIHLRMHSEYSIRDGIIRLDVVEKKKNPDGSSEKIHICPPIRKAVSEGMPALAITDLDNLFGMIKFYSAARKSGVKPILGVDARVSRDGASIFNTLILCKSQEGFRNLSEILSDAWRAAPNPEEFFIPIQSILDRPNGLIVLSGFNRGDIGADILAGKPDEAAAHAREWKDAFGDDYFIELQRFGTELEDLILSTSVSIANDLEIPVVATHPIQFMDKTDFDAHEARVCVADKTQLSDQKRKKRFTPDQYFVSAAEMEKKFSDYPEALANAGAIAVKCSPKLDLGKPQLPNYPVPDGETIDTFMTAKAREGMVARMLASFPDEQVRAGKLQQYQDRLQFEIDTIIQMGFPGYFMIVADFINWSKENGVPVGPGRGSGAGSLVAYSLNITDIDPMPYDLLFERFLNPERVSMPDFDVDFCQEGRDRVIAYVKDKYGHDAVSQIATFGEMAARSVIKDAGRVLGYTYGFIEDLVAMIPNEPGMTLAKAMEMNPDIDGRIQTDTDSARVFALARKLEGVARSVGMHAGGVLIAPGKLTDFCPLYAADQSSVVSQLDKDDVETAGLVKFDFLGLRTLTITSETIRLITRDDPGFTIDLSNLPLQDERTYQLIKAGDTTAVFQLEGHGMRNLVMNMQPDCFEDLIALVALFRPGPLQSGMVQDFVDRKHGRQAVDMMHDSLEPVLSPTYGVIVYQEQVMQMAQVLAGYTLGGADMLRRAMGKKKADEMQQQRALFVEGAGKNNITEKRANEFFDLMEKFAEYGFNKSHSAAYAMIAYQTAFLKAHHMEAFMAATMTSEIGDTDRLRIFIDDCKQHKIEVLRPSVNASERRFSVPEPGKVRYGLAAIKGVSGTSADAIVAERELNGPYVSMENFALRVGKHADKTVMSRLIKSGAFDDFESNRALLLTRFSTKKTDAPKAPRRKKVAEGQADMFGELIVAPVAPEEIEEHVPEWNTQERVTTETESYGFPFSLHPILIWKEQMQTRPQSIGLMEAAKHSYIISGVIMDKLEKTDKKGNMMAFVKLDDGTGAAEVTVFSSVFSASGGVPKPGEFLAVEVSVRKNEERQKLDILANRLYTWDEYKETFESAEIHPDPAVEPLSSIEFSC